MGMFRNLLVHPFYSFFSFVLPLLFPHVNYWSEVAFAWGAQPRGQGDSAAHCCALEALADRKEADLEELENRDYEKWLLAQLRMAGGYHSYII
jgi:hypothetical protein